ncbi:RNA polymerase sigma factor [Algoriphagus halophilus]|uniref:RNA polymerase sigma factor, sigma-70 family n=1 Tax=Algoriphagus halophilus TaxID=226505 RepID=A0A1N6EKR8_9BACT|nr:sigma-70 family RNA polymerase sigma factor [Algoriphagus halophilus]SIN83613.1 RNA polymerase sigma factor, sigma-70 family [Algoriphagus halophilus]
MKSLASSQDTIDELNCWNKLKEGERPALEFIYRKHINDLFNFGCSLLPDPDQVRDFIQEIFIDLWKYHANLQSTDNVKLYLFKCLSNKIYSLAKDEAKRKAIFEGHLEQMDYVLDSPENQLIKMKRDEDLRAKLSNALVGLPMRQKEVINYLFFEQLSYEQTSKQMNINLKSVYTLAWKAISSLKKSF